MHHNIRFQVYFLLVFLFPLVAVVAAAETYVAKSAQVGDWTIGPQPSVSELEEMQSRGVTLVISTRTPAEMAALGFDETSAARELGMQHLNIPIGGKDYPFSPAALQSFTTAVDASDGPILMHCRSGYRASVLAAGYLVKEQGATVDAAIETVGDQRVKPETVQLLLDD